MNTQKKIIRKSWRFTLIEMLVVISIIAILASLLMPSLMSAMETAVGMQCSSNQKSVIVGMLQYGNDFNNDIPYSTDNSQNGANLAYWTNPLTDYLGIARDAIRQKGTVFFCPGYDQKPGSWARTYGINSLVMHTSWDMSLNKIKTPSKIIIYGDKYAGYADYLPIPYTFEYNPDGTIFWAVTGTPPRYGGTYSFWKNSSGSASLPKGWRHGGSASYAFADGHVEMKRYDDVTSTRGGVASTSWSWFDW